MVQHMHEHRETPAQSLEAPLEQNGQQLACFKAYDVRGVVPNELNETIAYEIGVAYADFLKPTTVVIGRDVRPSGPALVQALTRGLNDRGVRVIDIGLVGTEQVYFATAHLNADGGIMMTASHNPPEYNGIKMVRRGAVPISSDTGLMAIEKKVRRALTGTSSTDTPTPFPTSDGAVQNTTEDITAAYIDHILNYVDCSALRPFKVVANAGNGCAGPIAKKIAAHLPIELITVYGDPDGSFPNGVPNPMLPENQHATAEAVMEHGADLGVAWDGDFDRCFFFDETGRFVEGYYVVGLLAEHMLQSHPGSAIVYDPKLLWNTEAIIEKSGGRGVLNRAGHAFIKNRMREENAVYGGEASAHHYFRDFFYCDSGMIPWLLVMDIMTRSQRTLSQLIESRATQFPTSGEINRKVADTNRVLAAVEAAYPNARIDRTDGLGMAFDTWRFNVRPSNTEPLLRLNVETRGDTELLQQQTDTLLALIEKAGAP